VKPINRITVVLILSVLIGVGCTRSWNNPYDSINLATKIQAYKPNITTIGNTSTTMRLTWNIKYGEEWTSSYTSNIYRDGVKIGTTTATYYEDYPVVIGTTYSYQRTISGEGVESLKSDVAIYKAN